MRINFDTEDLKPAEARGLISFLSNLFPASEQLDINWTPQDPRFAEAACLTPQPPTPTTEYLDEEYNPRLSVGKDYEESLRKEQEKTLESAPVVSGRQAQSEAPAATEPTPINQPATRHRRTKAEIAADEAAAAEKGSAAVTDSVAPAAAASGTTQPAPATSGTVSADELRALLNGYIAKHSMEEAIGQLQHFGCNRVTEALALDPIELAALAGALHG